MLSKPTLFSSLSKALYFVFAHLPLRIIANIIFYIAIISLLLHFTSYYIEKHPDRLEYFIEQSLLMNIKFSKIKVHYNLLTPSLTISQLSIFKTRQKGLEDAILTNDSKESGLHFKSASISFNLFKSLVFFQPYINYINLDGLNTSIDYHKDKSFSLGAFNLTDIFKLQTETKKNLPQESSIPLWLLRIKSFTLTNTQLVINDEINNIKNYQLNNIHIKFTNKSPWQHTLSLSITNNQKQSSTLPLVFDQINLTSEFKGSIYKLKQWTGKIFIALDNFNYKSNETLSKLIANYSNINLIEANGHAKFWADFSQSTISHIIADTAFNNIKLYNYSNQQTLKLNQISSVFKLIENKHFLKSSQNKKPLNKPLEQPLNKQLEQLQIKNWLASLYQLQLNIPILSSEQASFNSLYLPYLYFNIFKKSSELKVKSYIDEFKLTGWYDILNFINSDLAMSYQQIQPTGIISQVRSKLIFEADKIKDYQITAGINQLAMNAWEKIPKFNNLTAQLWINKESGFLDINSSDFNVALKPEFKQPWKFDQLVSQVSWQNIASQQWINIDYNKVKNNHLNIYGNAQIWSNISSNLSSNHEKNTPLPVTKSVTKNETKSPLLLISANFDHVDASYTPLYLPTTAFSKGLYDWLDKAFIAAHVPDGGVIFRGRLNQFPYQKNDGIMEITFHTKDLLLNYHQGWPPFEKIQSEIQFTETGMFVDVKNVQLYNSLSHSTSVTLNNYLSDDIAIQSSIQSNATDAFKFLEKTELLSANIINQLKPKGDVDIELSLTIPEDEKKPIISKVTAQLKNALFSPPWLYPHSVKDINGILAINNSDLSSEKIEGKLNDLPLVVKIKTKNRLNKSKVKSMQTNSVLTGLELAKSEPHIILVSIDGSVATETLTTANFIPQSLSGLFSKLNGKTSFQTEVSLHKQDGEILADIFIKSALKGIESLLPSPFNKQRQEKKDFSLTITDNKNINALNIKYADILNYCSQSNIDKALKIAINFSNQNCILPQEPSIFLSGKLDLNHYQLWQSLLTNENNDHKPGNKNNFPKQLDFNFEEIKLPQNILSSTEEEPSAANKEPSATNKEPSATNKEPDITTINKPSVDSNINPLLSNVLVNGEIRNLLIGSKSMGSFAIRSHPELNKIKFDEIKFIGDQLFINLYGTTSSITNELQTSTHPGIKAANDFSHEHITEPLPEPLTELLTELQGKILIKDSGKLLEQLDISKDLKYTDIELNGQLKWKGSLSSFSSKKLDGKIKFKSKKGYLNSINPGIGRIISIFNLNDLRRRLNLNFRDVSEQGFEFNSIEGNLLFKQQMLSTQNFIVDSSIARILIEGDINMQAKTCQHVFTIIPDISTGLPYAGMALAGPIGGAVGFLGQKIIGGEINKISQYNFAIQGLCSKPEIINKKEIAKDIFELNYLNY